MRKHGKMLGVGLLALILGTVAVFAWRSREPSYRGRTLTSWLQQVSDTPLSETQQLSEAQAAVRAIGAEKALPILLKLAEAQDGPIRSWVIRKNAKWHIRVLKLQEAEDAQQLGIAGFEVLGTNCALAVPELTRLLEDTNHAFAAVRCLDHIGKPAEFALWHSISNRDARVRAWGIGALAGVTDEIGEYINRVKGSLNDPNGEVRGAALQAIGIQTEAPDIAIPFLLAALEKDDESFGSLAATLLAGFGTNGLGAFNALSNAVERWGPSAASQALITLVRLAPKEALPIVFACLRSPEPQRRRGAAARLCAYSVTTPEIRAALEGAAADPDPQVSRMAKEFITKLYRAGRSDEMLIPNEPSYRGKRLGEWLKQKKQADSSFSKDAEDALRQMGTNAIPALLERLAYRQPPYSLKAYEVNIEAACAFMALGEVAKPALPKLEGLMDSDDEDLALHAMIATCGMGTDSIGCLIRGLTNRHDIVRAEAAHFLEDSIGARFPDQRKLAVPFVVGLLSDASESVRMSATNALREIDPAAAAKAGVNAATRAPAK
jgi:HEAT repeat protein